MTHVFVVLGELLGMCWVTHVFVVLGELVGDACFCCFR